MTRTPLVALLALAACAEVDNDRTLIDEPRLLALRSSSPVLSPAQPEAQLSTLLVDERGRARTNVEVRMRACSPWIFLVDPERDCPEEESLALEDGTITLEEVLAAFPPPQAGPVTLPDSAPPLAPCDRQALIEIPVIAETTLNGSELITTKKIAVYFDGSPRRNPQLQQAQVSALQDEPGVSLELSVAPDSVDLFCRDGQEELEPVRIFAYSNRGELDANFVDLVAGDGDELEPAELVWTGDEEAADALLWLVAIDSEGGTDWQELVISM